MINKLQPNRFFKHFFGYFLAVSLIIISFVAGTMTGKGESEKVAEVYTGPGEVDGVNETPAYLSEDLNFQLFWDAWNTVRDNYVDRPVNEVQMLYGAIAGLVDSVNDPHSIFFTPDVNKSFLEELSGAFYGIGAEIATKNSQLQIVAPLSDSPAEKAGLRAGDYILKINGEVTTKLTVDQAVGKIRGPQGTEVTLTVFRNGDKDTREFKIVRQQIKIESVSWKMLDGNIAQIKLRYFNQDTGEEFKRIATEIAAKNPSYIILDMRNNPGGYLDVAVEIASQFIEKGVIVSEKDYKGEIVEHQATGRPRLKDYKVVVLLNEGSASASEILAGALKDYGIGTIVGMKSYGKGSVQTLFDLSDGSSIKLTIAKWLMPKGGTIEGVGISPDVEVDLTEEDFNADKDPQLEKALEIIKHPLIAPLKTE